MRRRPITLSEAVLTALITGGLSVVGVVITNLAANRKMQYEIKQNQAVTETKIEELTREVREHNNFAHRVPVLENKVKVADHRLDDIEEELKGK
nr:MAG TPA: hypothetical protein [Caudoviricetes sp.]